MLKKEYVLPAIFMEWTHYKHGAKYGKPAYCANSTMVKILSGHNYRPFNVRGMLITGRMSSLPSRPLKVDRPGEWQFANVVWVKE